MTTQEMLIQQIEQMTLFDNRFSNMKCINNYTDPKKRQGNFSIIFSAIDTLTDENVVIKIFDPNTGDVYRLNCFKRESEILKAIMNKKRCLQLKRPLQITKVPLPTTPTPFEINLSYFATEILPIDVVELFNKKDGLLIIEKLHLMKEILLAIRALHLQGIYHRDLKPDNLRGCKEVKRIIIAIDLGTAIHENTQHIFPTYQGFQVGHPAYASPEAQCGLYGIREISIYNDIYSLGCVLFELFTPNTLFIELSKRGGQIYTNICQLQIAGTPENEKLEKWHELITNYGHIIDYPKINDYHNEIPKSVLPYIEKIFAGLIRFDYRERISIDEALRLLDLSICILTNEKFDAEMVRRRNQCRLNRKQKIDAINQKYALIGVCDDRK